MDFILKSWIEATQDFESVRSPALEWFQRNQTNIDAVYLLKFIVKVQGLNDAVILSVVKWCNTFPSHPDAICRISPLLSRYGRQSDLESTLVKMTLTVLECLKSDLVSDRGVREATLGAIGNLAFKVSSYPEIKERLDHIHRFVLTQTSAYSTSIETGNAPFVFNPGLAIHFAGMIERGVIIPNTDIFYVELFFSWLEIWPTDRKSKLINSLKLLEPLCEVDDVWGRVGLCRPAGLPELELSSVLEELDQGELQPHEWSRKWEEAWSRFRGEPELSSRGREWLCKVGAEPSWPYVWEKLLLHAITDENQHEINYLLDTALWWIDEKAPRERGAWAYVWAKLWDFNFNWPRLRALGLEWLRTGGTGNPEHSERVESRIRSR